MILQITKNTDAVWKKKSVTLGLPKGEIKHIVDSMKETLSFTMGVGLAAPQVGYPWRLFIIDYADLKEVFIDPKIVKRAGEPTSVDEGCLSIPGYRGLVERSSEIDIEYTNIEGKRQKAHLTGYYARIAQHEYDHLESTFYVDRVKNKKKNLYHFDPVKIVFFGSSDFSAIILKSLIGQMVVGEYEIPLVITSPDKTPEKKSNPVRELAREFKIPVESPGHLAKKVAGKFVLTNQELYQKIKAAKPDCLVLASYGKILPTEILELPKLAPVNVHPSLLPKYRGPSPLQTALLKGDKYTGVTIMKMNEKMDEGDIFLKGRYKISEKETTASLSATLATFGAELLHHVLHYLAVEKIKSKPQIAEKATYTKKIEKEAGKIDWKNPPRNLERMVRAYFPWPGVWTEYNGKILKLLPENKVQLEGKNPITVKDFKSGHKDFDLTW